MKYISIRQEDPMGCAIACVAFISRTSYQKSIALFEHPEKRLNKGYTVKEIVTALEKNGVLYRSRYVGRIGKPKIQEKSIVYVKKCLQFPRGHYLVKTKLGYMDPFLNLQDYNGNIAQSISGIRKNISEKIVLVIEPCT